MEEEYFALLAEIQKETYKNKTNKISPDLMSKVNQLASKIQEKRRKERSDKSKTQA